MKLDVVPTVLGQRVGSGCIEISRRNPLLLQKHLKGAAHVKHRAVSARDASYSAKAQCTVADINLLANGLL